MLTPLRLTIMQSDGTAIDALDAAGVFRVGDAVFGGIVTECALFQSSPNSTNAQPVSAENLLPIW